MDSEEEGRDSGEAVMDLVEAIRTASPVALDLEAQEIWLANRGAPPLSLKQHGTSEGRDIHGSDLEIRQH